VVLVLLLEVAIIKKELRDRERERETASIATGLICCILLAFSIRAAAIAMKINLNGSHAAILGVLFLLSLP
jgi:hypothetical protein